MRTQQRSFALLLNTSTRASLADRQAGSRRLHRQTVTEEYSLPWPPLQSDVIQCTSQDICTKCGPDGKACVECSQQYPGFTKHCQRW